MADTEQQPQPSGGLAADVQAQEPGKLSQSNGATETVSSETEKEPQKKTTDETQPKPPSKIKQLWTKIGLDLPTILIMIKGSLPPIISIAMYQSPAVAAKYTTLGYLIAIMSILGFCIMPRGKFIQTMTLNILGACLGAAFNLLALYCATQARIHTTPLGASPLAYNSSASAICAIFLIVQLYLVNVLRAAKPQFQFPAIVYCIFANVSMTYGVAFPTMTYALSFMTRLLEAFLAGFGIASAVSFIILPTSSRMVVFKEMTGYMMSFSGILKAQTEYMQSLEDIDPVANRKKFEEELATKKGKKKSKTPPFNPFATPASQKLKITMAKTLELHTKLSGDITPAKREFAWGKLESHDITEIWKLLRMAFVPIAGLSASIELIQRRASDLEWAYEGATEDVTKARQEQLEQLHFLMKTLHNPFSNLTGDIDRGIQHVLLTLELTKAPKKKQDEEAATGGDPAPGSPEFAEWYSKRVSGFHKTQEKTLDKWCKENGINLPADFFESTFVRPENWPCDEEHRREKNQRSLFFTLYLEYLLWRASSAILDMVLYADKRKAEGALKSSKLIFPGSKTLYKWVRAVFGNEDYSVDSHFIGEIDAGGSNALFLGADFGKRKDPEHLPPTSALQRVGDRIRKLPRFFRSDESAFGFRVAAATMSIAIVCYLRESQQFFLKQRLLWAMIMVAISMTRTAGQSVFTFGLRIIGTIIAMIGAYIIWYIVNGHTAGVLVFLWVWLVMCFYFVLKTPKLIIVAILGMVTTVLIIGYELQTEVIGKAASTANGQPFYETYLLAPYRLACVTGGLLVAFIWTIFPFPVSEAGELRKDLGTTLYLTSNFYSIIHETLTARVKGTDGDSKVRGTHAYNLEKSRNSVFNKLVLLIQGLKLNSEFSRFQIQFGGRFPREEYVSIIDCCNRIVQYTALIGYASSSFSLYGKDGKELSRWSNDFREIIRSSNNTSHQITSLLALLSSSLINGQPLPPYLEMPQPFQLTQKLNKLDPDLLSIRHIAEPEYGAYSVIQICAMSISRDIEELTRHVKTLVGEIDFSFHAVRSSETSSIDEPEDDEKSKEI